MKKILLYIGAMAAMVSCTEAPIEELTPEAEGREMSVRVGLPVSRVAIGDDWSVSWEDSDALLGVGTEDYEEFTMSSLEDGVATFRGVAPTNTFNLIYPSSLTAESGEVALDLTTQSAETKSNYMISSEMIEPTAEVTDVQLKHLCSYLEIILSYPEYEGTLTSVSLSGFNSTCNLDATNQFSSESYTELSKGKITTTNGLPTEPSTEATIRLNILPTLLNDGDKVQVVAVVGDKMIGQTITVGEKMMFERAMYNTIECSHFAEVDWSVLAASEFAEEGKISSAEELALLAKMVNESKTFENQTITLTKDIDLTGHEWVAIGNDPNHFKGTFDGAGHAVTGLYINKPEVSFQGLFSLTDGATIKNLSVSGSVTGNQYAGGVVGQASSSTIINCYNSCSVTGSLNIGGIVGSANDNTTISNCYNSGSVKSTIGRAIGGVVGYANDNTTISNCYNRGSVEGGDDAYVGGVAGNTYSSTITNCYWDKEKCTKGIYDSYNITTNGDFEGMTAAEMQSKTFNKLLNNNAYTYNNAETTPTVPACAWEWTSGYPTLNFDEEPTLTKFSGGSGTESDPYKISCRSDFDELSADVNGGSNYEGKFFVMTGDVDMGGESNPFAVIGFNKFRSFHGTFDGVGHAVTGLYINTDKGYIGLFSYTEGATIKNLSVSDSVTEIEYIGAVVGGVVGAAVSSTITNCYNSGSVESDKKTDSVGGVVGLADKSTITNCYNSGSLVGGDNAYVGGVVGWVMNSTIINCYNSGSLVSGDDTDVGGVVGNANSRATITNCYNSGSLVGGDDTDVGGVVGWVDVSTITNCYNSGSLMGGNDTYVGGVVGYVDYSTFTNCYWDKEKCTVGIGYKLDAIQSNIEGMTEMDMQDEPFMNTLNANAAAYNNGNPAVKACGWGLAGSYPFLTFTEITD